MSKYLHRGRSQGSFYDIHSVYGEGFFFSSSKTWQTLLLLTISALEGNIYCATFLLTATCEMSQRRGNQSTETSEGELKWPCRSCFCATPPLIACNEGISRGQCSHIKPAQTCSRQITPQSRTKELRITVLARSHGRNADIVHIQHISDFPCRNIGCVALLQRVSVDVEGLYRWIFQSVPAYMVVEAVKRSADQVVINN